MQPIALSKPVTPRDVVALFGKVVVGVFVSLLVAWHIISACSMILMKPLPLETAQPKDFTVSLPNWTPCRFLPSLPERSTKVLDATQLFDGTLPNTGSAITVTRVSTNVLDLLVARDVGASEPLGIHVDVLTTFTSTVSTTLTVDFEVCDTEGGTYLNILSSPIIPKAQLIAGSSIFRYALPVNQVLNATAGILKAPGRYIRLNYVVTTGPFDTGALMAYLTPRMDRNAFYTYPKNYTAATAAGELS